MNAWKALLQSRKFWLIVWGTIVGLAGFIIGLVEPAWMDNLNKLVLILEGLVLFLISAICYEDGQQKRAGGKPGYKPSPKTIDYPTGPQQRMDYPVQVPPGEQQPKTG